MTVKRFLLDLIELVGALLAMVVGALLVLVTWVLGFYIMLSVVFWGWR